MQFEFAFAWNFYYSVLMVLTAIFASHGDFSGLLAQIVS